MVEIWMFIKIGKSRRVLGTCGNQYLTDTGYRKIQVSGILADMDFTVYITYHTMLQSTPFQLVFGCIMILNNPFIADRGYIWIRKQQLIDKNNQKQK